MNKSHGNSPLFHMRHVAQPEDYVVFKLDIDNNTVEEAIVASMLADVELLSVIDEFFWEHHIDMVPHRRSWGRQTSTQRQSIALFRTLREAGVRAHSWV